MVEITIEQAKEFLNKIGKKEKVAIIHHDDCDGFVSGILFYDHLKKKGIKADHFCLFSGGDQKEMIKNLIGHEIILIADLAPSLVDDILNSIKDKKVLYVDHHKKDFEIPDEILEFRTISRISASKSVFAMVGGRRWLEISALLSDVGYSFPEYRGKIERLAKEEKLDIDEFLKKYYFRIDYYLDYFYKDRNNAFDGLRELEDLNSLREYSDVVEKEVEELVKGYEKHKEKLGEINFYLFDSVYPVKSRVTTSISFRYPDETFVFVSSHPMREVIYAISARNQSGEVDCAELLKNATRGFEDASGGGHAKAAGGYIRKEDLEQFKRRLKNFNSE